MRVGLISDELTRECLISEVRVDLIGPYIGGVELLLGKPDFLLVESCWSGNNEKWKFRVASYPEHEKRNNKLLERIVIKAKNRGIPTVFWNKEDSIHYDRFISSARLFDYVFTVDSNCLPKYRLDLDSGVKVNTLMFPVQPKFHSFTGFNFKYRQANFVGSYSRHVHDRRRSWQEMLFNSARHTGLSVFDRNSSRKSPNYRYPDMPHIKVHSAVSHARTAEIYKDYLVSLNVNTVEDSPSMYSRRLVEILACGGILVTSPARSVDAHFRDYCHVVSTSEEADDLLRRLKYGPSPDDLDRARAGAEYVLREHTWARRIHQIATAIGIS